MIKLSQVTGTDNNIYYNMQLGQFKHLGWV